MAKAKGTPRKTAKKSSARKPTGRKKTTSSKRTTSSKKTTARTTSSKKTTRRATSSKATSKAKAADAPTKPRRLKGKVPTGTKERLEAERQDLERQLGELDRRSSEREPNGAAGYGDELADAETETIERERELSLSENFRDLLDQVEHALQRIDDGTYGVCESCGKRIEAPRLRALPYASRCIECKRREERRG